jgi:hypothetical protein
LCSESFQDTRSFYSCVSPSPLLNHELAFAFIFQGHLNLTDVLVAP